MLNVLQFLGGNGISLLLLASITAGAGTGHFSPDSSIWLSDRVDATLLLLIGLLFFGVRFNAIVRALGHLRFIAVALLANFVLVPCIGWAIASLVLPEHPLLMVGLVIYFMSPCTDWFLGFTRLAKGNVALGTALIPINMVVQLLLYPLYLHWFTRNIVPVEADLIGQTLLQWFLLPLVVATAAHHILHRLLAPARFARLLAMADHTTPWVIALLVMEIFAANIDTIVAHRGVFGWLLLAVFLFFIATFVLGEALSRMAGLRYPEHALLTLTIAARNAPLMLAISMAALPDQPLIHAAIVIGMLLEFPHLTLLRQLLLRSQTHARYHHSTAGAETIPTR